jgi:protein PhnA
MTDLPKCTQCGSNYTYENGSLYICPECGHEWAIHTQEEASAPSSTVRDAHGTILQDGDSVTIIKDIKVKDIRLVDEVNGHNIEAKVPGFGLMMLKSEIVKKST